MLPSHLARWKKSTLNRAWSWVTWYRHWLYSSHPLPGFGNRLTYHVHMGWERILRLKIHGNFKTWKEIVIFLGKRCDDINFQTCEKSLQYHTCTYTKFLAGNGNGSLYLSTWVTPFFSGWERMLILMFIVGLLFVIGRGAGESASIDHPPKIFK